MLAKFRKEVQDIHHYVRCLLVIGLMACNPIHIDQDDGCSNLSVIVLGCLELAPAERSKFRTSIITVVMVY
jgi:hypothetical protein